MVDTLSLSPPYFTLDNILKGTTMTRVCQLAEQNGMSYAMRKISLAEFQTAREILITGTSLNVLPVTQFENEKVGNGMPGEFAKKLNQWLLADIQNKRCGTPF